MPQQPALVMPQKSSSPSSRTTRHSLRRAASSGRRRKSAWQRMCEKKQQPGPSLPRVWRRLRPQVSESEPTMGARSVLKREEAEIVRPVNNAQRVWSSGGGWRAGCAVGGHASHNGTLRAAPAHVNPRGGGTHRTTPRRAWRRRRTGPCRRGSARSARSLAPRPAPGSPAAAARTAARPGSGRRAGCRPSPALPCWLSCCRSAWRDGEGARPGRAARLRWSSLRFTLPRQSDTIAAPHPGHGTHARSGARARLRSARCGRGQAGCRPGDRVGQGGVADQCA